MNNAIKLKLQKYIPTDDAVELVQETPMLFVVGVFGAGKGTVIHQLLGSGKYHKIVSHTTRPKRENDGKFEQDGIDYHFVDFATAEHMISEQAFLEAKLVHDSDIYGTSTAEIQMAHDEGKTALTDIDVQGVVEYMQVSNKAQAVFLLPPSFDVWQERLNKRYGGQLPEDMYRRRMNSSLYELGHALESPYFHFVVNNKIAKAVADIEKIHERIVDTQRDANSKEVALELLSTLKSLV